MLQKTTRKIKYQTKPNWSDYTEEIRELGTKKSVLDIISIYCELNEDTDYEVYNNEKLLCSFSNKMFVNNEETGLSLFTAQKLVASVEIEEEKLATGLKLTIKTFNEETKKEEVRQIAEVLLKHRLVKIIF